MGAYFLDYNQMDYINQCFWNPDYNSYYTCYKSVLEAFSVSNFLPCWDFENVNYSNCLSLYVGYHSYYNCQYGNYLVSCPLMDYD